MLRVGRIKYNGGSSSYPSYDGFTNIVVMMKSHSKWSSFSPYYIKDDNGYIFENVFQFSKVYEKVPKSVQKYSRYSNQVIWDHPAEIHMIDDVLTPEYYAWRQKGMSSHYAIRYPVGFKHRTQCKFALKDDGEPLGYIDSRKQIYVMEYCRLVKELPEFLELRERLNNGENLMIVEVDGPHQESLDYYKDTYGVDDDFIQNNTMVVNKENIGIMLNDPKHPFGHGYCLAIALLDKNQEWNE